MPLTHTLSNSADLRLEGLLKGWLSTSESQICALETLRAQLPEVDHLLTSSMADIADSFVSLASKLDEQTEKLGSLRAQLNGTATSEIVQEFEKLDEESQEIRNTVSRLVVNMQFQDRVSQNLVITVNVMNAIIGHLKEEIDETTPEVASPNAISELLDRDFAGKMISLLNLGDLQRKFTAHLLEHGYIDDPDELGLNPDSAHSNEEDEIELF